MGLELFGGDQMPSSYAHYQFGTQVLPTLPADIRFSVQRYRTLYDLGLQGPDFFFYYKLGKDTAVKQLAGKYHHRTGRDVFGTICRNLSHPTDGELAYLYGLLGHYCLDSLCHPLVNEIVGDDSLAHNALESEFERFLMERSGVRKPHSYNRGIHLKCSKDQAALISRFYPEARPAQIHEGLNTMSVVLALLTIHAGAKKVLELMGDPNPGLLMHKMPDPAYVQYNDALLEGFNRALVLYPELLQQLHSHMAFGGELGKEFENIFG